MSVALVFPGVGLERAAAQTGTTAGVLMGSPCLKFRKLSLVYSRAGWFQVCGSSMEEDMHGLTDGGADHTLGIAQDNFLPTWS